VEHVVAAVDALAMAREARRARRPSSVMYSSMSVIVILMGSFNAFCGAVAGPKRAAGS